MKCYFIVTAIIFLQLTCVKRRESASHIFETSVTAGSAVHELFNAALPEERGMAGLTALMKRTGGSDALASQLLAKGRSLQAEYISAGYPRILLSFNERVLAKKEAARWWARVFFGYSERADQLEVVSYNREQGRFEFFVVEEFSKKKLLSLSRIERVDNFECSFCHQNGGPVFAVDPWSETNSSEQALAAITTGLRRRGLKTSSYFDLPVSSSFVLSQMMDQATDAANAITGTQLVWRGLCTKKERTNCRLDFLRLGVASLLWPQDKRVYQYARRFWQDVARWSESTLATLALSSIGDELMDVQFVLPMQPDDDRPVFTLKSEVPSHDPLGFKHDSLSEEFSERNGYSVSIALSWLRRFLRPETFAGFSELAQVLASEPSESCLAELRSDTLRREAIEYCFLRGG